MLERGNPDLPDTSSLPSGTYQPPSGRSIEEKVSGGPARGRFRNLFQLLRKLAEYGSTQGLVGAIPGVLHDLGFTTSDITWLESPAELAVASGEPEPTKLDHRSVEADAVRRRQAIVVDAACSPNELEPRWIDGPYLAAPLIVGNAVAGIVHVASDHVLDETDGEVIVAVTDTLGYLIERNRAREQLSALRRGLREMADSVAPTASSVGRCGESSAAAHEWAHPETRAPGAPRRALAQLTRRELETLAHLAAGETNARIARQLVISEGTVKSHVRSILRKLGAANRAEAVSTWFRANAAAGSPAAATEHPNKVRPAAHRRPSSFRAER